MNESLQLTKIISFQLIWMNNTAETFEYASNVTLTAFEWSVAAFWIASAFVLVIVFKNVFDLGATGSHWNTRFEVRMIYTTGNYSDYTRGCISMMMWSVLPSENVRNNAKNIQNKPGQASTPNSPGPDSVSSLNMQYCPPYSVLFCSIQCWN